MEEKKLLVSHDTPFLNSQCLFVEYDDVIASPFFIFLDSIKNNENFKQIFELSQFENLDIEEIYEWYINRETKNIFQCIPLQEGVLEEYFENDYAKFTQWTKDMLKLEVDSIEGLFSIDSSLNFASALYKLMDNKLVHKIYVYSEFYSDVILHDLEARYEKHITFLAGDLVTVLKEYKIPADSTFVFSNIQNIYKLKEAGILNFASIVIADWYRYNYDSNGEPKIDLPELLKENLFKIDFFDNINSIDE